MIEKILNYKNKFTEAPLIHCITNPISINDCANVVLALGGKPIMAEHPDEVREITRSADALAINLGNITDARMKSILLSGEVASNNHIPSIIDLVGVSCSSLRMNLAKEYITKYSPIVIKGNLSELKALLGLETNSKGVDASSDDVIDTVLLQAFSAYSKQHNCVLLASGVEDLILYLEKAYFIKNGVPMLARITGTGCMLNVMIATYLSQGDSLIASILATAILGIAGELSETDKGSGTFRLNLLDNIYTMNEADIRKKINIKEVNL